MADKNIGKITQVVGAVLDLKFSEGNDIPVQLKYRIDQWRDRPGGFVFN